MCRCEPPFCAASCRPHFLKEAISPCPLMRAEPGRCPLCTTHTEWNVVSLSKDGFVDAKSREVKFDGARASPVWSMSRRVSGGWYLPARPPTPV